MRRLTLFVLLPLAACAGQDPVAVRWQEIKTEIRERFPDVPHWTTEQVRTALAEADPPLLIDVRARDEYDVSHLPGAIHVDRHRGLDVVPRDTGVIVYCSVGWRSAEFTQELREAGHVDAYNYLGSIFEWANRGLPIEDQEGPTDRVHPYDADWGQLLDEDYR